MIAPLTGEVTRHGERAEVVPVNRLQDLRQDLEDLKDRGGLNNFQQYIVDQMHSLEVPQADFEIRSVVIIASPSPAAVNLRFHYNGKTIPTIVPASYVDKDRSPARIEAYLKEFLQPQRYHVLYANRLPRKLLAVRIGLGQYGRNNICYVEGMGSFLNLNPYFTDIPCPDDWIAPSAHHTLYGCIRCQVTCPANKQQTGRRPGRIYGRRNGAAAGRPIVRILATSATAKGTKAGDEGLPERFTPQSGRLV